MASEKVKLGDYVIIQRQKYIKLHKFGSVDSVAALGKDQIELRNVQSLPWFTTFKMVPKNNRGRRLCALEPCADVSGLKETLEISVTESGTDNRNVLADAESQTLKPDDIVKLRESCNSASEIVGHLVENSKTFAAKTEYAQDKYLKKKEKKYFEYVQIRKPSIRMLTEIMYRQDSDKICGLRMDSLSQLVSYSGVSSTGNYLTYESGTNGLIPAALLNSIGANTEGKLLHMHPGNVPQKQALLALNLEKEQLDRCISVNLYSVLRQYYQNRESTTSSGTKRKIEDEDSKDHPPKVAKTENGDGIVLELEATIPPTDVKEELPAEPNTISEDKGTITPPHRPKWVLDNERGIEMLRENFDGLVIVAKEHPSSLLKALLPFVKPSRPVVIFNQSREILMDIYMELKGSGQVTGLRITSNWLRQYQVLPNRTHPDVNMSGNSGFLLCGFTIR